MRLYLGSKQPPHLPFILVTMADATHLTQVQRFSKKLAIIELLSNALYEWNLTIRLSATQVFDILLGSLLYLELEESNQTTFTARIEWMTISL
jgi:hypothetical protein